MGNGVSVSYSEDLSTASLTEQLLEELSHLTGTEVHKAIRDFAATVEKDDPDNFESLLGPFDAIAHGLSLLGEVRGPFGEYKNIIDPLNRSSRVLGFLHSIMYAKVLRIIDFNAHGGGNFENVSQLASTLVDTAAGDLLTVCTLNYDNLLLAALLNTKVELSDLAMGAQTRSVPFSDELMLDGYMLRNQLDFPGSRKVRLIQLHGSLSWFNVQDVGNVKFDIGELREYEVWDLLEQSEQSHLKPLVILTNKKTNAVRQSPFSLAYEEFNKQLRNSKYWCIIGYGFGDIPVNNAIARQLSFRYFADEPTKIFVSGTGNTSKLRTSVRKALGGWVSRGSVEVFYDTSGSPDCLYGDAWCRWLEDK